MFLGTVGKRMAGTKNPSSRRDREAARAPSFSPMMMGMIGEGELVCPVREVRRAMLWFSFSRSWQPSGVLRSCRAASEAAACEGGGAVE